MNTVNRVSRKLRGLQQGAFILLMVMLRNHAIAQNAVNEPIFIRGDVDASAAADLSDAIVILSFLFLNAPDVLPCYEAADCNDDGYVDIADPIFILMFDFDSGDPPPAPFPWCGTDPTRDTLGCEVYEPCGTPPAITDSLGIKLVFVSGGIFEMGSPESERGRFPDETMHTVTLSCGMYIGAMEVTQEQYQKVMRHNPSVPVSAKAPVNVVTWFDAIDFCKRLSALDGRKYDLPTEAEWEYACRSGTTTRFSFGDALECDDEHSCSPCSSIEKFLWWCGDNNHQFQRVGEKQLNQWGLYDMHGNIAEWCRDWYGPYPKGDAFDPVGPFSGSNRVIRGSGWYDLKECRCAGRAYWDPTDNVVEGIGFRIVHEVPCIKD